MYPLEQGGKEHLAEKQSWSIFCLMNNVVQVVNSIPSNIFLMFSPLFITNIKFNFLWK